MKKWDLDHALTRRDCLKVGVWSIILSFISTGVMFHADKIERFVYKVSLHIKAFFKKCSK